MSRPILQSFLIIELLLLHQHNLLSSSEHGMLHQHVIEMSAKNNLTSCWHVSLKAFRTAYSGIDLK